MLALCLQPHLKRTLYETLKNRELPADKQPISDLQDVKPESKPCWQIIYFIVFFTYLAALDQTKATK